MVLVVPQERRVVQPPQLGDGLSVAPKLSVSKDEIWKKAMAT